MLEDLLDVVLMQPADSKITLEVSTLKRNYLFQLITKFQLLDGVLIKVDRNIGLEETHGEPIGEKVDFSK